MTPTMIKALLFFVICELIACLYDLKNKGLHNGFWGTLILVTKTFVSLWFILLVLSQMRYLG